MNAKAIDAVQSAIQKIKDLISSCLAWGMEEHVQVLQFDKVLEEGEKLVGQCPPDSVSGFKCYIVEEPDGAGVRAGIFPVDATANTFGGEDVVMKVLKAKSLDEKLASLLPDGQDGSFFIPYEKGV